MWNRPASVSKLRKIFSRWQCSKCPQREETKLMNFWRHCFIMKIKFCQLIFAPKINCSTSFEFEFSKKSRKNSWKFVYFLAKQWRTPFNLTIFFNHIFLKFLWIFISYLSKTYCDTLYIFGVKIQMRHFKRFFQKIVFF